MSRDSNGDYTLPAGVNPVVAGTTITDDWANTTLSDVATALTDSWDRQGRGAPLANLPMGSFKFTGMAAGSASTDSIRYGQALNQDTTTIASASTVDLANTAQSDITVTGTTTITSFGTGAAAGVRKFVTFTGALTITNGANLVCPGGSNITTAAGRTIVVRSEGSNVWRVDYEPAYTLAMPDGTVSAPGLAFANDLDNGFYRIGTNNWAVSVGGTKRVEFNNAGDFLVTPVAFSVTGTGAVTVRTALNTGTGITVKTDDASGGTSAVVLYTGAASLGTSGSVSVYTGAGSSSVGELNLYAGSTTVGGSAAAQGGHVNITSGSGNSSTAGFAGNIILQVGDYGTGTSNGVISFKLYTDAGAQVAVAQVRSRENLFAWCTDTGSPTISSGAGTGATIVGTNYGFIVTLGTTPGSTIVINLAAWGGASSPANAPVVVAGSTNSAYRVAASATTSAVTITTSSTPTAADKLHVILNWFASAL